MIKGTGIIRRIDDLGRIAIPKEIRKKLEVKKDQPMEILVDPGGRIILQKYHEQQEAIEFTWHFEITQEQYEKESLKEIYDCLLNIAKQDAEKQKYEIIDDKINVSFDFQKDKKLVFITVSQNVLF